MKLADALEQRNPNSQYIAMVMPQLFGCGATGECVATAVAYGERAIHADSSRKTCFWSWRKGVQQKKAGQSDRVFRRRLSS